MPSARTSCAHPGAHLLAEVAEDRGSADAFASDFDRIAAQAELRLRKSAGGNTTACDLHRAFPVDRTASGHGRRRRPGRTIGVNVAYLHMAALLDFGQCDFAALNARTRHRRSRWLHCPTPCADNEADHRRFHGRAGVARAAGGSPQEVRRGGTTARQRLAQRLAQFETRQKQAAEQLAAIQQERDQLLREQQERARRRRGTSAQCRARAKHRQPDCGPAKRRRRTGRDCATRAQGPPRSLQVRRRDGDDDGDRRRSLGTAEVRQERHLRRRARTRPHQDRGAWSRPKEPARRKTCGATFCSNASRPPPITPAWSITSSRPSSSSRRRPAPSSGPTWRRRSHRQGQARAGRSEAALLLRRRAGRRAQRCHPRGREAVPQPRSRVPTTAAKSTRICWRASATAPMRAPAGRRTAGAARVTAAAGGTESRGPRRAPARPGAPGERTRFRPRAELPPNHGDHPARPPDRIYRAIRRRRLFLPQERRHRRHLCVA